VLYHSVGLVDSTCQVVGYKDFSEDAFSRGYYLRKDQAKGHFCVDLVCYLIVCLSPALYNIFRTSMARYSLFVLKLP